MLGNYLSEDRRL